MPISGEWMNSCVLPHTWNIYSATKRREALTLTIMWTYPENPMLSEKQTQKDTQGVTPLMGNVQSWQIHRHREWAPGCQGLGGRGF